MDGEVIARRPLLAAVAAFVCSAATLRAQSETARDSDATKGDSSKAGALSGIRSVLERGARVMGVDLNNAKHEFDLLPDGGRIRLVQAAAESTDSTRVASIRKHLRSIAVAFSRGDFKSPEIVHGRVVPGTKIMAAKRAVISYRVSDLDRGGEVWIMTHDSTALGAIKEFVEFQRADHSAGGKDSSAHDSHHAKP